MDHPWARVYDFFVEREALSRPLGWLLFGTETRLLYDQVDAIARVQDGGSILDIPCGGGVALRGLRPEQDVRYVAADISEAMLERTARVAAGRGLTQVQYEIADVEALPFADGEFDLILSFAGLHVFPRPAVAVREIARCLAPGGRFSGSVFLTDGGVRYLPLLTGGRAAGLMGPSGSGADVRRWLLAAGLTGVELRRSGTIGYFEAGRAVSG
jgi:ubiquinone/menaquinone biosynthesis C-methylase UbiE